MGFGERNQAIGLVLGLAAFVAYWAIVIVRAATDGLPFAEVAWQGPMLWSVGLGGGLYAVVYGTMRWRARGSRVTDERDAEIERHAEAVGAGLTGLAVLATLIMLALDVDTFWAAHVLFVGAFLGSMAGSAASLAAYREGVDR
ncbi:hypothetical protein [Demequina sp.]|uniref:hypothetical protein n=1 Tax=Demequina sp. TaxID=2050685 RepID=UPI0025D1128C|nr:hypothetical protein [Demequina sp.]